MAFKSAKNFGSKFVNVVRVVNKDSNFLYIPNKLSKSQEGEEDNKTEIRMLPYIDGTGEVWDPLHPEGTVKEMDDSLGIAFCKAELLQFFKGGMYTLLTTVKDEDREGNPVNGPTPWSKFMRRMDFKMAEVKSQLKQGGEIEPGIKHWAGIKDGTFSRPQELYFIQCLAKKINGDVKMKDGKPVPVGPAVFAIPRYIQTKTEFFSQMLSIDDDAPEGAELSPETCVLGDFYSLEQGKPLRLSRIDQDSNTIYSMSLGKKAWPLKTENVKKMVCPWDEILDVQSVEDSIKEISKLFEPRMLAYAFRNSTLAPYLKEVGIDVDIANDIIEAEVAIVKGERKRSKEEIHKYLGTQENSSESSSEKEKGYTEKDDIQYTPDLGTDDEETENRYQEALGDIGELEMD